MSFSEWLETEKQKKAAQVEVEAKESQGKQSSWTSWIPKFGSQKDNADCEQSESLLPRFLRPSQPEPGCLPSLSTTQRWKMFFLLITCAAIFFAIAFFIGLPLLLFAPAKFAVSFTLGSILFSASFAVLEGPGPFFSRAFSWGRAPFTLFYVLSLGLTLYSSLVWHSYILVVISSVVQIAALLSYASSHIPGGQTTLNYATSFCWSTFTMVTLPIVTRICSCKK